MLASSVESVFIHRINYRLYRSSAVLVSLVEYFSFISWTLCLHQLNAWSSSIETQYNLHQLNCYNLSVEYPSLRQNYMVLDIYNWPSYSIHSLIINSKDKKYNNYNWILIKILNETCYKVFMLSSKLLIPKNNIKRADEKLKSRIIIIRILKIQ